MNFKLTSTAAKRGLISGLLGKGGGGGSRGGGGGGGGGRGGGGGGVCAVDMNRPLRTVSSKRLCAALPRLPAYVRVSQRGGGQRGYALELDAAMTFEDVLLVECMYPVHLINIYYYLFAR